LRVLQEGTYRPVGSSIEQLAAMRVVAASNAELEDRVQSGAFRADLYYRLSVFSLLLPPLRERGEDVLLLAEHLLDKHAPAGGPAAFLAPCARAALLAHDWPGNVRELENAMIRATHLCVNQRIVAADLGLPLGLRGPAPVQATLESYKAAKQQAMHCFERDYLRQLIERHQGNLTQAARAAGKELVAPPAVEHWHVINLMEALKQSVAHLQKPEAAAPAATDRVAAEKPPKRMAASKPPRKTAGKKKKAQ
jgi:two-component system, NtrC family, response regulator GlrR